MPIHMVRGRLNRSGPSSVQSVSTREDGDAVTFEDWLAASCRGLLRFADVLCGGRDPAEEVVQDVAVKVHARWTKICRLEHPTAYVRRMIVNEHLSWRRKWSRIIPQAEFREPAPSGQPQFADQYADRLALIAELQQAAQASSGRPWCCATSRGCPTPTSRPARLLGRHRSHARLARASRTADRDATRPPAAHGLRGGVPCALRSSCETPSRHWPTGRSRPRRSSTDHEPSRPDDRQASAGALVLAAAAVAAAGPRRADRAGQAHGGPGRHPRTRQLEWSTASTCRRAGRILPPGLRADSESASYGTPVGDDPYLGLHRQRHRAGPSDATVEPREQSRST